MKWNDRPENQQWLKDYAIRYQKEVGRFSKKGITKEDYNKVFIEQDGCCGICGVHQEDLRYSLHIDHCHDESQRFRGLLCNSCNTGLGKLGDNEEGLLKALKYLRKTK